MIIWYVFLGFCERVGGLMLPLLQRGVLFLYHPAGEG